MNTSLPTRISPKADIRSGSGCDWERGRGLRKAGARSRHYTGLLVQVRPGANTPRISYTRGLDLSGTLAGAGGIGGLLARSRHATSSPYAVNGSSLYHADGNGNVTYLASSSGGADAAYRYDPFGRWLAQTGPDASANVMRFSSKPWLAHNGSNTDGLYSYGYRFYDPLSQQWINRDLIGEYGGINLYAYVGNNPVNFNDPYGLAISDWWDLRTWFNEGFTESWYDSANSIGQALGGALAGDWNQIEDAYDSGIFGETQDAGPVPCYGTRAAVGVATVCATAAAAVGTYEFVALGNQSIMVEGVLGGGRMGSGGLFQLRVPGQQPIIRFDFHPFPGSSGRSLPHVDSPPLGRRHWPWQ